MARLAWPMLAIFFLCLAVNPVAAQSPCDQPNILPNCNFDNFVPNQYGSLAEGWIPFILSGTPPSFGPSNDTYWGPPSLELHSNGTTFSGGVYYQVPNVVKGATYKASIAWGAPNAPPEAYGRQLGIDPYGGTDWNSSNVVKGPIHFGPGRMLNYPPPDVNIDVVAEAQADKVTVFVYVEHTWSGGDQVIFIDAVSLVPVKMPAEEAPTSAPPTDTPAPPTDTPKPPSPTRPPVPTATGTPTDTPTFTPVPTDTPTPTATATPTGTPTPTQTVTPTRTRRPTRTPTPTPDWITDLEDTAFSALPYLIVLALFAGLMLWLVLSLMLFLGRGYRGKEDAGTQAPTQDTTEPGGLPSPEEPEEEGLEE
jgi:hypothetical protein